MVIFVEEVFVEFEFLVEVQIFFEELNFLVCVYNCFKWVQVNFVFDLMGFSYEDFLEIKNFGFKFVDEVIEVLECIGIFIFQSCIFV